MKDLEASSKIEIQTCAQLEQFDQDMRELCHLLEVNRKETWVAWSQILLE